MAAIFEFGVWTQVRVFTVYFSKLKVQLSKVELDIKCESVEIAGAGLLGPLMSMRQVHVRRSTRILGAACEMPEHAGNGLFVFFRFKVSTCTLRVSLIYFSEPWRL